MGSVNPAVSLLRFFVTLKETNVVGIFRRAAPMSRPDLNPIQVTRLDFIDTLLSMCQYHHPSTIQLPPDYVPPSLAISNLYWGALQNLLIVISLNPSTIGHQAWTQYPMLKGIK